MGFSARGSGCRLVEGVGSVRVTTNGVTSVFRVGSGLSLYMRWLVVCGSFLGAERV